ncbi:hypothetical protein FF125_11350 [Aureibaculum algae]|uniref:Uncharacterized protein n=1 Tax=Aureibaculum algae TaxID=2584122 RepID=A0A5B7TWG9_9FLAO|nr:DUF6544 family protein [Aureibaculum algae]QCX39002.1 hypothetical protein FF125_11350 [Aureibaculum algae]
MRLAFAFLILIHGLIHLMGFVKAFRLAEIHQLSQSISKPMGIFWLFSALLFILSAVLYLVKQDLWIAFAIIGVLISQVLILMFWKDAKFGTIANVIILLITLSAYGNYRFKTMVDKELNAITNNLQFNKERISQNDIDSLPLIVQKWMQTSGVIGKEKIISVRLKQVGEMRTEVDGKWKPFSATQYFNIESSSFIWTAKIKMMPLIDLVGRDKLINGKGEMLIKLSGLIAVVNESDNIKINTGAMIRYLAETCWFPTAGLEDAITWENIDVTTAKATLKINNQSVSGLFKFNSNGDFISFEADRYYGGDENAQLEKWVVTAKEHKEFYGIKIPNKCQVTWKLKEGDFNWLNVEITDIEYTTGNNLK